MKKIVLVLGVGMLALASCKKDFTCECTVNSQKISIPYNGVTKSDATDACNAAITTYQNSDPDADCTLD